MGKKLGIQGHDTRGDEVIKLLEMLGGTNPFSNGMVIGNKTTNCYYISEDTATKYISWDYIGPDEINEYEIFTLEEFWEKYPFKVGDKVIDDSGESGIIIEMKWDEEIIYKVDFGKECYYFASDFLRPYKEEVSMEDKKLFGVVDNSAETKSCTVSLKGGEAIDNSIDSVQFIQSGKIVAVRFNTQNYENEVELQLDDYEIEIRNGKTYAICKKPKYKYPTTYKECCDVLSIAPYYNLRYHTYEHGYSKYAATYELCSLQDKLNTLGKLLICQNAYWKIAGEELGLGKPWEPDWSGFSDGSYPTITKCNDRIVKTSIYTHDCILAFPTEEMRDAFYENFKDLIEQTKELL